MTNRTRPFVSERPTDNFMSERSFTSGMARYLSDKAAREAASSAEIVNTSGDDQFSQAPQKANPVAADRVLIEDSENSFAKKWSELGDIPGTGGSGGAGTGQIIDGGRRITGASVIAGGRRV